MELPPDNLYGMTPEAAKEYVAAHLATKRLNEKKLAELDGDFKKWTERVDLARSKGAEDLVAAAEAEAARIGAERDRLAGETRELESQIERMRRQIPGLEARRREIDPDLLEQELLIAAGRSPGDEAAEAAAEADRTLSDLEKNVAAEAELAALKARMAGGKEHRNQ